jgi:hypothetical protein
VLNRPDAMTDPDGQDGVVHHLPSPLLINALAAGANSCDFLCSLVNNFLNFTTGGLFSALFNTPQPGPWSEQLPAGVPPLSVLARSRAWINIDCTYGSGSCGGGVYSALPGVGVTAGAELSSLYQVFPPFLFVTEDVTESMFTMDPITVTAPVTPWYQTCGAKAAGSALLHGAIDALGLIPVLGGEASDAVGFAAGLLVNDPSDPLGNGLTGVGSGITLINKSIQAARVGGNVAKLVPFLGQAVSALSLGYDGIAAFQQYQACIAGINP